jgi:hypothetical protein
VAILRRYLVLNKILPSVLSRAWTNWNVVIDAEELVGNVTKDDFIYLAVKLVSDL